MELGKKRACEETVDGGIRILEGKKQKRTSEKTPLGGRIGQSATRSGSHLLSASLPKGTIHQQREQGKINSYRPAKAAAQRVVPSLTDRSSQLSYPSRLYYLSLLTSFCSTNPPFFPSPAPDYYALSFPINHAGWQLISVVFDSFRSSSSH